MKKTLRLVAVALLLMQLVLVVGCATNEEKIVGTWTRQETGLFGIVTEVSYTFNEDGTGKGVLGADFTYTVDGDTVTIVYTLLDSIEVSNETFMKVE